MRSFCDEQGDWLLHPRSGGDLWRMKRSTVWWMDGWKGSEGEGGNGWALSSCGDGIVIAKSDASLVSSSSVPELKGWRFISEDGSKSPTYRHVTAIATQAHLPLTPPILHFLFISSGYFFSYSTVPTFAIVYTAGWSLSLGAAHGPHERGACQTLAPRQRPRFSLFAAIQLDRPPLTTPVSDRLRKHLPNHFGCLEPPMSS